ncbi:MAG: adenine deaminase [Desulfobacteraceae bacterium]|nr:adenine deaminase [Desulfobacteraceae bacterium]MCB9494257.1 adenine deaminase [Desulfobacteraceae bacterium]
MAEKVDLLLKNLKLVNVYTDQIEEKNIALKNGKIEGFGDYPAKEEIDCKGFFVCPGLIDSHVHIESSMVSVPEFAKAVLKSGTTTVVADPHEIANVLGTKGIDYMIESSKNLPVDVFFMIPSCVPSTNMETSGAVIEAEDIRPYFENPSVAGLGEVMNYPGVIGEDPKVLAKINACLESKKAVDGHAPFVSGKDLCAYVRAGVSSDHECVSHEEALEKLSLGMKIMVREGTCARNLNDLFPAINEKTSERMMWCTDDRHPHDLSSGHISEIIRDAVALGLDPSIAIRMGTLSPCGHFNFTDRGAIAPGKTADLIIFKDLSNFTPHIIYKSGIRVFENGKYTDSVKFGSLPESPGIMNVDPKSLDFSIPCMDNKKINIIGVIEHQVITERFEEFPKTENGFAVSDVERDILKLCVVERYSGKGRTGKGFVKGFGIKKGAFASSVGHDSHNIIVCGTNDEDMKTAVKKIIEMKGGFAVCENNEILASLPLPIAGLMSEKTLDEVKIELDHVLESVKKLGALQTDPFISLGFLSLPVIPRLKLTDFGLVDVEKFEKISLFTD